MTPKISRGSFIRKKYAIIFGLYLILILYRIHFIKGICEKGRRSLRRSSPHQISDVELSNVDLEGLQNVNSKSMFLNDSPPLGTLPLPVYLTPLPVRPYFEL